MRTSLLLALVLLGIGVLLKQGDIIVDTPASSAPAASATARAFLTPRAELTPDRETVSTVAVASKPPPVASMAASPSGRAVDSARTPVMPTIAAIGPAPSTPQVIPGSRDDAEAIASVIESPAFQDTVSPVARLYFAYFDRIPDYEGLNYYIAQREGGRLLDAISNEFAMSREIEIRYGSLDNAAFVDRVFQNVFDGVGDAQQRASWIAQLESGAMTRGQMMLAFSESAAFRTAVANEVFVSVAYAEILGRSADPAELSHWVGFLDTGHSAEAVIQGLLATR
jgi:hypothetical protein